MTLLRAQVESNSYQSIEELSNALIQSWSTIQEHLQHIGKTNRAEPFFDHLITADEKWVLYDNPKRKRQCLSPNKPPRRTAKPGLRPKKALLCVWWGIRGSVHFEVLKPGETVNADLYCEQLDRLNQSLIEKCPAIINRKEVSLQHDNSKLHCARKTLEKINGLGWEVEIGGVAIYRPFGEFRQANSYYHLYGAQGQANDKRTSSPLMKLDDSII
ncbi:histone-lysine N-methyltransferase SETMAR [Trichonephila clavipes]|nr:histone-lysine N-methyltransferase SETMAR [Trichonephila clavipes]